MRNSVDEWTPGWVMRCQRPGFLLGTARCQRKRTNFQMKVARRLLTGEKLCALFKQRPRSLGSPKNTFVVLVQLFAVTKWTTMARWSRCFMTLHHDAFSRFLWSRRCAGFFWPHRGWSFIMFFVYQNPELAARGSTLVALRYGICILSWHGRRLNFDTKSLALSSKDATKISRDKHEIVVVSSRRYWGKIH